MAHHPEALKAGSPLRILVVEDSALLGQIFSTALSKEHEIVVAPTAKEGWNLYLQKVPHIVFLDVLLPDGNGHDLAHKIKARNPKAYVVMATACDFADDKEEAAFNHVDGFLVKPFGKEKVDEAIGRYWDTRRKTV